jgi:hypothetical protein
MYRLFLHLQKQFKKYFMARKKIPEREKKTQVWLQVKKKYLKEATIKVKEIQRYFDLRDLNENQP